MKKEGSVQVWLITSRHMFCRHAICEYYSKNLVRFPYPVADRSGQGEPKKRDSNFGGQYLDQKIMFNQKWIIFGIANAESLAKLKKIKNIVAGGLRVSPSVFGISPPPVLGGFVCHDLLYLSRRPLCRQRSKHPHIISDYISHVA